jgi:hypothetical protein
MPAQRCPPSSGSSQTLRSRTAREDRAPWPHGHGPCRPREEPLRRSCQGACRRAWEKIDFVPRASSWLVPAARNPMDAPIQTTAEQTPISTGAVLARLNFPPARKSAKKKPRGSGAVVRQSFLWQSFRRVLRPMVFVGFPTGTAKLVVTTIYVLVVIITLPAIRCGEGGPSSHGRKSDRDDTRPCIRPASPATGPRKDRDYVFTRYAR